mgnify:FL=1|tara:strand:- start:1346 stop:1795 length:450 start_codon:yes stop_codon:yes gene_type:complete
MTTESKAVTLGQIGEEIIFEIIENAKKTNDWYDNKKDGTIKEQDGTIKTYEVKTMRENFKHKALFQNVTQFKKLDNVDYNFWVRVPERLEDGIKIYEYFADEYYKANMNGTSGRMYSVDKMDYVATIEDERTQQMMDLSKKMAKHKRFK